MGWQMLGTMKNAPGVASMLLVSSHIVHTILAVHKGSAMAANLPSVPGCRAAVCHRSRWRLLRADCAGVCPLRR